MLAPRDGSRRPLQRSGPDPVAGLSAVLLGLLCLGLLVAAFLAVYDYNVSPVERPVVLVLAAIFTLIVALNVLAATARWLRTLGR
jgi:predicted neutral ceramidase superfamily lipid hydrolase